MPQSLRGPRERISQAKANVDEPQLRRTWEELEYHVGVCIVNNGAHIKHLKLHEFPSCFQVVASVTVRKIHQFLFTKIIYNSPVFCGLFLQQCQ
jgi:hypothetical protein